MSSELPLAPSTRATRTFRYAWFASLAAVGCAIDLVTKASVFSWLGQPDGKENIYWLVKDYIGIETALNEGALFGAFQGLGWLFCLMSFLALAGIVYCLVSKRAIDDWLLTMTLGIITGGILGNLYDRLGIWSRFQEFAVRDWIRFSYDYNRYVWPNFNVADSLLVCGAAMLFWHFFRIETTEAAS